MQRSAAAFVLLSLACVFAHAQPARKSLAVAIAEQKAREAESAAAIASNGQLLYEADDNKKAWGQYCIAAGQLAERGEFRRAIREASKALFLGERDRNASARTWAMRDLAYAYSLAGELAKAEEWAHKSLEASRSITNPNVNVRNDIEAPVRKILGDIAARRARYEEAMASYSAALEAANATSNNRQAIRVSMGMAELRRGSPGKAREILAGEAAGGNADLAATARRGLGECALAEGKPREAVSEFSGAADAAAAAKNAYAEMWARHGLARAQLGAGDSAAAASSLDRAIELAEGLRGQFRVVEFKSGFFGDVQQVFDLGIELAANEGNAAKALALSEQSRARAASDLVRGRGRTQAAQLAPSLAVRKPAEVASVLPEKTVVVVYHVLSGRTLGWTVRREGVAMKPLSFPARELEASVQALRTSIVEMAPAAADRARQLHAALVAPLGLRDGETVVFVPHKSLHLAPLHALGDARGTVMASHPVAYALSLSALAQSLSEPPSSSGPMLALGNPDLGDPELDLPAAEQEVREIGRIAGAAPFVRKEASAQRFRTSAPASGMVHVAAHAMVDEVDPLYSTLKLAAGDVEAREIYDMDLSRTRLVALSACSSGMGKVSGGDEFFGFKRSFLVAGARTLLVTLWPVADESTARLMQSFYRHRETRPAAEALRLAQVEVSQRPAESAPIFWAPFVLVGDWR